MGLKYVQHLGYLFNVHCSVHFNFLNLKTTTNSYYVCVSFEIPIVFFVLLGKLSSLNVNFLFSIEILDGVGLYGLMIRVSLFILLHFVGKFGSRTHPNSNFIGLTLDSFSCFAF